jgi:phosphoglycerate dehydrogenase-like enzyme
MADNIRQGSDVYCPDGGRVIDEDDEDIGILILRKGGPGLSAADFRDAIQKHLPDRTIRLAHTPEEERDLITDATVVTGNEFDRDLLKHADHLRLYAHTSSGVGNLPIEAMDERSIALTNAAGLMPCIAEQVLGYLLVLARQLHEGLRRQRKREWRHYQPTELTGHTITVVGLGSIGTQVLERLDVFGVETIGVRHTPEKGGPADHIVGYGDLHAAFRQSDYVVLSCPLTDLTQGLVGSPEFDTLPNDAVLINVARGKVVDTDALVTALQRNLLGGAALDVTDPEPLPEDHPLWRFDNVILTPHNAGNSPAHWDRVAGLLAENLKRVDETGKYANLKNQII